MNAVAVRLAPTAVALAAGVYVVWPYLGPSEAVPAAAQTSTAAAELPEALLRPKLSPPPARDPFEDPQVVEEKARAAVRKRLVDLVKRLETARKAAARPRGPAGRAGADPLDGLVLNATYAREGRGAAVINGRVYQTGQNVRPESVGDPCVLTRVGVHSVSIQCRGQERVLGYVMAAPAARQARPTTGTATRR